MQKQTTTHIQAAPAKLVYTQPKLELHTKSFNHIVLASSGNLGNEKPTISVGSWDF